MKRIAFALAAIALVSIATTARVSAQQAGDTVFFAVSGQITSSTSDTVVLDNGISITTGPDGDKVLFIGRPLASVAPGGCGGVDNLPRVLQPAMFVDPGSGSRATRSDSVLVLSAGNIAVSEGLANGTRLGDLSYIGPCNLGGGAQYQKFQATIE